MRNKKYLSIVFYFVLFPVIGQNKIEYKPNYPSNFKDTLFIVNKDYTRKVSGKVVTFTMTDRNWDCKKVSFVHYLPKENLKAQVYNGVTYKERNMNKLNLLKKDIKKYKKTSFRKLKQYSKNNYGCNNLESYLSKPTIYFVIKENKKYVGYEVLPLVWGISID